MGEPPADEKPLSSRFDRIDREALPVALSNALVELHKRMFGRGPTKARTSVSGDVITCVLEDGLTRFETTLARHRREADVRKFREGLYEASRVEVIATVEALSGQRVRSYVAGVDPTTGVQVGVFVLDAAPGPGHAIEQRAKAARADSLELQEQQRALVAQQQQTAAEMQRRTDRARRRRNLGR